MIWLASFPRSGNTFFRNVLYEVYGISSGDYYLGIEKKPADNFAEYPVVKTHLHPDQLPQSLQSAKSIYLIRDGRDASVSLAHHRKDIKKNNTHYLRNLAEIIFGIGGSFPGGWSTHVQSWASRADVIIRFEDLIRDPVGQMERLRTILDLPPPQLDKLPTFETQKKGIPRYGSGEKETIDKSKKQEHAQKFYRRGKVGSYKDEMPLMFQWLFWLRNRKQMKEFNYY